MVTIILRGFCTYFVFIGSIKDMEVIQTYYRHPDVYLPLPEFNSTTTKYERYAEVNLLLKHTLEVQSFPSKHKGRETKALISTRNFL